jgi:hypothetical protein
MTYGALPLPLFYHPDYAPPLPSGHRFPMSKYALLLPALAAREQRVATLDPELMPVEWLHAVHDPAYVDAVLSASVPPEVERRIGLPVTPAVARRTRLVAGGTYAAALHALTHGWAANGAGGSHHAGPDGGAGYCVTNDLAIAANRLVAEGAARSILIVDCDVHQGDGTARIMAGRCDIITLSIHAEKNFPVRKAPLHSRYRTARWHRAMPIISPRLSRRSAHCSPVTGRSWCCIRPAWTRTATTGLAGWHSRMMAWPPARRWWRGLRGGPGQRWPSRWAAAMPLIRPMLPAAMRWR